MRKILLINDKQLPGAALLTFLHAESAFEVIGFTLETMPDLIDKINQLQPDLIVLDQATVCSASIQCLLIALQNFHNLSLLVVSADYNEVKFYRTQRLLINHSKDLVSIVYTHC